MLGLGLVRGMVAIRNLPPMKLSREYENEPLGNIHHSLSLRKELSSILIVNEEIPFVVGVAQILLHRHMTPTRTLGVLAHYTLEVNSNLPLGVHGMIILFFMLFKC